MDRRQFLQRAALLGGAAALGGPALAAGASTPHRSGRPTGAEFRALTDLSAKESPVDTIVVVMQENRSFDHYLGWLADDERYVERGRSRYGKRFKVDGKVRQSFAAPDGTIVNTAPLVGAADQSNPFRGCDHYDPGHGWRSGRAQRDAGFLADGSGNDTYALGYYVADDLPFTSQLAREFMVSDRWFASLLSSTYPNRNYFHAAQSGNAKTNAFPTATGGYPWETIWERLAAKGVDAAYYFTDLPYTALYGQRLSSFQRPIEQYFSDAEAGTLPSVAFVDPSFLTETRTDDHPHADIRAGQRFLRDVFAAFTASPQWKRGVFTITYDEWGGFFDHVAPPVLADNQRTADDAENWGQAGFRVPTVVASPFVRRGYVDHTVYDHTSVLRFIEWRFLGAPAQGPGKPADTWFLTERDRHANNLGAALAATPVSREVGFDLDIVIDPQSDPCVNPDPKAPPGPPDTQPPPLMGATPPTTTAGTRRSAQPSRLEKHPLEQAMDEGLFERMGVDVRVNPMAREWAKGTEIAAR